MSSRNRFLSFVTCLVLAAGSLAARAELPADVRRELTELKNELRPVAGLLRKKEVDAAVAIVQKVEDRLAELNIAADERDRNLASLKVQIERARASIPVSFERDVAPILTDNCLRCHGPDRAAAGLRMDTFNNMARGSANGVLAVAGSPQNSRLVYRIMVADEAERMPRNAPALSAEQINTIGRWIAQGAAFDGTDRDAVIGTSAVPKKPEISVIMADGTETISFRNDVAPVLVNICAGCHGGNNPRAGFSVATFETLLQGGESGTTIVPGDPDGSYIVDLTLRQDPIKMPAGQGRLKRSQAKAIETWIAEGAHFDGTDPKAPLRSLVPTAEDLEAARLADMSEAEFRELRIEQAATMWKRVAPRVDARSATTTNLYVYGSVPESRIEQFAEWGEQQVAALAEKYKLPEGTTPWRGRLIVFVTAERFDYEEFNTVLLNRRTPPNVSGHVHVTTNLADAYLAMHDIGNTESADSLNAQQLQGALIAQAWLQQDGRSLPDWLREGFGLMESGATSESPYLKAAPARASQALATLDNPAQVFNNGTFAPQDVAAVGYMATRFLMTNGGAARFQWLLEALRSGRTPAQAVQQVYGQDATTLGRAFLQSGGR